MHTDTYLIIRLPPAQSRAWEDGDDWHMWLDLLDDLTWAGIPCLVRVILDNGTVVGELDPTAIEGHHG